MSKQLNPDAAEFVPSSYKSDISWAANVEDVGEDHITEEELAEIEACEAWVALQAELEGFEEDHLVAVALNLAPAEKVKEVQRRALKPSKVRGHKGIHSRGMVRAW